ncbi:MAG TPA: cytochrome c3 family protein [Phycisphaerae bacterium]|nr:hypothetical protein [Planctomycetales bacterium]MCB9867604.1 hypothetical protein [Phycisphaerales bacterium]HRX86832.1 cytochrome c3 family protein [Phycisphaerae bacterium]
MRKLLVVMALLVAAGLSCTPEARQRAKHFFFEVPDESAGATASTESKSSKDSSNLPELHLPPSAFVSIHPPYADQQCDACHNAEKRMNVVGETRDTCGECHEDFFDEDKVTHFPVASGDCLSCHQPHRSRFPALLVQSVKDTCAGCHDTGDLSEDAHQGDVSNCVKCHDAHFGGEYLLKKDFVPAKAPEKP